MTSPGKFDHAVEISATPLCDNIAYQLSLKKSI